MIFSHLTHSMTNVKVEITNSFSLQFCRARLNLLQDVLILSRMTYLSLSGLARDCCTFTLRKLKVHFTETFFVVKVMLLALI